jgi:hypothetical protein
VCVLTECAPGTPPPKKTSQHPESSIILKFAAGATFPIIAQE